MFPIRKPGITVLLRGRGELSRCVIGRAFFDNSIGNQHQQPMQDGSGLNRLSRSGLNFWHEHPLIQRMKKDLEQSLKVLREDIVFLIPINRLLGGRNPRWVQTGNASPYADGVWYSHPAATAV
jgi:hypothetical protein